MKMVNHMALPFVTICAMVSVTVMAYEANYAGNPVTVTNGWDSRQYIATSILRIDPDSAGANVMRPLKYIAFQKNCPVNLGVQSIRRHSRLRKI